MASLAEETFLALWRQAGGKEPVREHRFASPRRWRFDFCWLDELVAVEIQGWGRHQRFVGFDKDCQKFGAAAALGWRVIPITPHLLKEDPAGAVELVRQALALRPPGSPP